VKEWVANGVAEHGLVRLHACGGLDADEHGQDGRATRSAGDHGQAPQAPWGMGWYLARLNTYVAACGGGSRRRFAYHPGKAGQSHQENIAVSWSLKHGWTTP